MLFKYPQGMSAKEDRMEKYSLESSDKPPQYKMFFFLIRHHLKAKAVQKM